MNIIIRQEETQDHPAVFKLIESAFSNEVYSDQTEQHLVNKLRLSTSFIPELSLVGLDNKIIVGHILLTKIQLNNNDESTEALALAPVSVLPSYQNQGVGLILIKTAHDIAKGLNYPFVIVVGHKEYYPRFGYENLNFNKIKLPFEVPEEVCFIKVLQDNLDIELKGKLTYDPAFFD